MKIINCRNSESTEPTVYQLKIQGHLGNHWSDWFNGLNISHEKPGETSLTGWVVDQAALHGLLKKIRDLGIPLILVKRLEHGLSDERSTN